MWCWRRLLRIPWTARRSNQLILKEINPEYSLEGLMLKLKLQYFGHLMWTANSLEKNPDAGKDWRQKEKRVTKDEMAEWHHQFSEREVGKLWEMVRDREAWHAAICGVTKSRVQLSDWKNSNNQFIKANVNDDMNLSFIFSSLLFKEKDILYHGGR